MRFLSERRPEHYRSATFIDDGRSPECAAFTAFPMQFISTAEDRWSLYRQFNTKNLYVLPKQCVYVFCVDLRTNSDYFPIQH